ncbi:hypothetical protein ACIBHX_01955 [Nonomuraea sp. NPDC050536]|uniref:hypothetical protein n=1 Tax=Nonomuraea sp. NPDC050536 TaxID=3364366 RepID=UPI0037CCA5F9
MSFLNVAFHILLGLAFICSGLGSIGAVNGLLYVWQAESNQERLGVLTHVGIWLASVMLFSGILYASILNGWLGFGVQQAGGH